jgi:hypothetical protein
MAVKGQIDWDSIIKWDVINKDKEVIATVTRDDFEEGDEDEDDKKRSVPLVRSVKFRA